MKSDDNGSWKASQAEFMGYVRASLEHIKENQEKQNGVLKCHEERLKNIENSVLRVKTIASLIGMVFGAIGGYLLTWARKYLPL